MVPADPAQSAAVRGVSRVRQETVVPFAVDQDPYFAGAVQRHRDDRTAQVGRLGGMEFLAHTPHLAAFGDDPRIRVADARRQRRLGGERPRLGVCGVGFEYVQALVRPLGEHDRRAVRTRVPGEGLAAVLHEAGAHAPRLGEHLLRPRRLPQQPDPAALRRGRGGPPQFGADEVHPRRPPHPGGHLLRRDGRDPLAVPRIRSRHLRRCRRVRRLSHRAPPPPPRRPPSGP